MKLMQNLEIYEQKLQALPKSYRWMILAAVVLLIGAGGYFLVIEERLQDLQSQKERLATLERSIHKQNPKRLEAKIVKMQRQLVSLRTEIDRLRSQQSALLAKLQERRTLFLSQKSFSKLLEQILADSYRHGLELQQVAINDSQKPFLGKIFEKKVVDINGTGSFLPLVRFLRRIESSPLLLKIDKLHIETNGTTPAFSFRLKLYGARG